MLEIVADPPSPSCYLLFSELRIEEFQCLDPDPFPPARALATGVLSTA